MKTIKKSKTTRDVNNTPIYEDDPEFEDNLKYEDNINKIKPSQIYQTKHTKLNKACQTKPSKAKQQK